MRLIPRLGSSPRRAERAPLGGAALAALALTAITVTACGNESTESAPSTMAQDSAEVAVGPGNEAGPAEPGRPHGEVEVIRSLPHDPTAFTQGLEVHGDTLYESTGRLGSSWIATRPLAGPVADVTAREYLPPEQFGEGMAVTATGELWQLTWQDGVAYKRDAHTLAETGQAHYDGEGWGLCAQQHDGGERLVMSDGTERLSFRDPTSFDEIGSVVVQQDGKPVRNINELECVGGDIYANIWLTDQIVRIDPQSGAVTGTWDLGSVMQPRPADRDAVLNGIAAMPGSDTFLVTGKLWPEMFEVRLR